LHALPTTVQSQVAELLARGPFGGEHATDRALESFARGLSENDRAAFGLWLNGLSATQTAAIYAYLDGGQ